MSSIILALNEKNLFLFIIFCNFFSETRKVQNLMEFNSSTDACKIQYQILCNSDSPMFKNSDG